MLPAIITLLRPRQWLKNVALYAPLVFSHNLFFPGLFWLTTLGAVAFCFLSSSNYILNDVIDAARDRLDPFKKNRPVASRVIPEKNALLLALAMALTGLGISMIIGNLFFLVAIAFVVLHWASHLWLRRMSVLDVLALAGGYLLRIVAGETISNYHLSVWLFLTVLAFSLLLAIGKRRAELSIIKEHEDKYRRNPDEFIYSEKLLDTYVAVFANATFLTYTYFAFLTPVGLGSGLLGDSGMLIGRKWLMVTIPFVLYGVLRYLQIIYEIKSGTLSQALSKDIPIMISVALWGITTLSVIYAL